jgi:hypothetical protein
MQASAKGGATCGRDSAASSSLEAAWNNERLRVGDHVGPSEGPELHPNQYSPTGVLHQAWVQLGKNKTLRDGVDGQHRSLEILSTVAAAASLEQADFVEAQLAAIRADGAVPVVAKFYDCTPLRVGFGRLQPVLMPCARYPLKLADDSWRSVSLEEYLKARPDRHKSTLRYGVVELLAQGLTCHHLSSDSLYSGFRVLCKPLILQAASASCIYSATESEVKASGNDKFRRFVLRLTWFNIRVFCG